MLTAVHAGSSTIADAKLLDLVVDATAVHAGSSTIVEAKLLDLLWLIRLLCTLARAQQQILSCLIFVVDMTAVHAGSSTIVEAKLLDLCG
jgi:hypothetical protein